MTKNYYEIEIQNLQNGYMVNARYRTKIDSKDFSWEYKSDRFVHLEWDDVVKFISENKMTVPPASDIND